MTTNVLPQLQAIASDLSAQEKNLTARLEELREQLRGVRAVIPMFENTAAPTAAPETPELNINKTEEATSPTVTVPVEKSAPAAKKSVSSAAKRKTTSKKKKTDGRAASWQKYTRPGVKNESIPDAVRLVLSTQPEKDFKIAEVMDALFKEDMPKSQYLKARNRISNVLSGGARAGDWYRGDRSTYRLKAA